MMAMDPWILRYFKEAQFMMINGMVEMVGMLEGALIPKLMAFEAGNDFPQRDFGHWRDSPRLHVGMPPPPSGTHPEIVGS